MRKCSVIFSDHVNIGLKPENICAPSLEEVACRVPGIIIFVYTIVGTIFRLHKADVLSYIYLK